MPSHTTFCFSVQTAGVSAGMTYYLGVILNALLPSSSPHFISHTHTHTHRDHPLCHESERRYISSLSAWQSVNTLTVKTVVPWASNKKKHKSRPRVDDLVQTESGAAAMNSTPPVHFSEGWRVQAAAVRPVGNAETWCHDAMANRVSRRSDRSGTHHIRGWNDGSNVGRPRSAVSTTSAALLFWRWSTKLWVSHNVDQEKLILTNKEFDKSDDKNINDMSFESWCETQLDTDGSYRPTLPQRRTVLQPIGAAPRFCLSEFWTGPVKWSPEH